ncbi:MAG: protein-export chaperone SecB, partial [Rhodospirillales bacterium]|nr:protein-export chaperone SecB [Rhodospirillales bacterium]
GDMQKNAPSINVNVNVDGKQFQEKLYEVVLSIRAECSVGENVGFILELAYAGLFTLNVPSEQTQFFLLVECPRHLFPFARNVVCDVTRDGGFPPMMLDPIDFVAMLQNSMKEAAAKSDADSEA